MNDTTMGTAATARAGAQPDAPTSGAPSTAVPPLLAAYAEAVRVVLQAMDGASMALEFNRTPIDSSRDMLRQQQDAAVEAARRTLRGWAAVCGERPASGEGDPGMGCARLGLYAVDGMMRAMRVANDAAGAAVASSKAAPADRRAAVS
jgi:hypothetical protein